MLLIVNLQNRCFYFCCRPFHEYGSTGNLYGDLHTNILLLVSGYFHFFLSNENITEFTKIPAAFEFDPDQEFMKHIYSTFILYFGGFVIIFTKILLQILRVWLNFFASKHFLKYYLDFTRKYPSLLFQFSRLDYQYF